MHPGEEVTRLISVTEKVSGIKDTSLYTHGEDGGEEEGVWMHCL